MNTSQHGGNTEIRDAVTVTVGPAAELTPGSARRVDTPAGPVAVFNIDGELLAVADTCTHADASLSEGYLDGFVVECPRHGALFDLHTGEALSLPACVALRCFPVHVRDGIVLVEV
jgi:3-phenylpropionate/trans-cinnamate dioxygenase ferredoxin subunit